MRNPFVYTAIVTLLVTVAIPKMGMSKTMECTYPVNTMISDELSRGIGLNELFRYLGENKIRFLVFSEDAQTIDISTLTDRDIRRLGKLTITVVSRNLKKWKLVREKELLTIRFDKKHRLARRECEKFYTGP